MSDFVIVWEPDSMLLRPYKVDFCCRGQITWERESVGWMLVSSPNSSSPQVPLFLSLPLSQSPTFSAFLIRTMALFRDKVSLHFHFHFNLHGQTSTEACRGVLHFHELWGSKQDLWSIIDQCLMPHVLRTGFILCLCSRLFIFKLNLQKVRQSGLSNRKSSWYCLIAAPATATGCFF